MPFLAAGTSSALHPLALWTRGLFQAIAGGRLAAGATVLSQLRLKGLDLPPQGLDLGFQFRNPRRLAPDQVIQLQDQNVLLFRA